MQKILYQKFFLIEWGLKKEWVEVRLPWSKIILTKGCRLVFMSSSNADMIAVSLACPKDPKSPYSMGPPS